MLLQQRHAEQLEQRKQDKAKKASDLQRIIDLSLQSGVRKGSLEFFALGVLARDDYMTALFLQLETAEQRIEFIREYMRVYLS